MKAAPEKSTAEEAQTDRACEDCGQWFRNPQGLSGHRRLAHPTDSLTNLNARESELGLREQAVTRRETEIEKLGPAALGMVTCRECGSWFETPGNLGRHVRTIHPIENAVAGEVGVGPERVTSVWIEACRKQERHPSEGFAEIVRRFWDPTDRAILERLLARNAAFRFSKEGG